MDFFTTHDAFPLLTLFGLAFFPRITLLFMGGPFMWLQWIGWVFTPHLLVAIMATNYYWESDPILVIISWAFAFGGSSGEAHFARKKTRTRRAQVITMRKKPK